MEIIEQRTEQVGPMIQTVSKRHRLNITTTSKGLKSYDCTVEITNGTREEVQAESDAWIVELDKKYPPPKEEK